MPVTPVKWCAAGVGTPRAWCWYAARLALVRHAPEFGTPRRWRRYSVCVSDANFHPARAMSDVSKHNRMEFVDFPPSLFSPLSLCTKLLLPVSPLCLPARWGKILNIHQMMQVILVLRDFFSILRVAFYLSKILDLTIFFTIYGIFLSLQSSMDYFA